jgi:hypothetical protein
MSADNEWINNYIHSSEYVFVPEVLKHPITLHERIIVLEREICRFKIILTCFLSFEIIITSHPSLCRRLHKLYWDLRDLDTRMLIDFLTLDTANHAIRLWDSLERIYCDCDMSDGYALRLAELIKSSKLVNINAVKMI